MSQENVDAARRWVEDWNRGDVDPWLEAVHRDIEFWTSGVFPGTDPVYRGHADMRRFWNTFREPWESLEIRVDRVREVGDEVLVLGTFEAHARDGMRVERKVGYVSRFVDDLVARVDAYKTWEEALKAAGLSE